LFITDEVSLRKIFEVKTGTAAFLSTERVNKAKQIMDPFVLRRKKDEVTILFYCILLVKYIYNLFILFIVFINNLIGIERITKEI